MPGTDALEDASADHERFEAELVAEDQDAARILVADIDEGRAHSLVHDLVDDDVVDTARVEQSRVVMRTRRWIQNLGSRLSQFARVSTSPVSRQHSMFQRTSDSGLGG